MTFQNALYSNCSTIMTRVWPAFTVENISVTRKVESTSLIIFSRQMSSSGGERLEVGGHSGGGGGVDSYLQHRNHKNSKFSRFILRLGNSMYERINLYGGGYVMATTAPTFLSFTTPCCDLHMKPHSTCDETLVWLPLGIYYIWRSLHRYCYRLDKVSTATIGNFEKVRPVGFRFLLTAAAVARLGKFSGEYDRCLKRWNS
jgi:hypothetical protein